MTGPLDHDEWRSRWALLGIPPTVSEEVVLVPCDGCRSDVDPAAVAYRVTTDDRPHLVTVISAPSLALKAGPSCRMRVDRATAVLALAGCERECPAAAIREVAPAAETVRIDGLGGEDQACRAVVLRVDEVGLVPPLDRDDPWEPPEAALAPARPFITAEVKRALSRREVQARVAASSSSPTTSAERPKKPVYFAPEPSGGGRWWLYALAALLLAGVVSYFLWPWSGQEEARTPALGGGEGADRTEGREGSPRGAAVAVGPASGSPARMGGGAPVSGGERGDGGAASTQPGEVPDGGAGQAALSGQEPADGAVVDASADHRRDGGVEAGDSGASVDASLATGGASEEDPTNRGWIGWPCRSDDDCPFDEGYCQPMGAGAYCTKRCTWWCPDRVPRGRTKSSCVDPWDIRRYVEGFSAGGRGARRGLCIPDCDAIAYPNGGCRAGTLCVEVPLRRQRGFATRQVCLPVSEAAYPAEPSRRGAPASSGGEDGSGRRR